MADIKRNLRHGGPIRGPGTGTSDDIKATVPEGSYIMPADSTLQAGIERLRKMKQAYDAPKPVPPGGFGAAAGFRPRGVPVNLSNGEHALSPEQVHAVGETVLNAVKDVTHTPAAGPERMTGQFFADGGKVDTKAAAIQAFKERMKPRTPQAGSVSAEGVKVSSASDNARKFRERMTPRSNPAQERPKGFGLKEMMKYIEKMESAKKEEPRFNFRELARQEREKRDRQAAPRKFDALKVLSARFGMSEDKLRQSFANGGPVWEDPERRQASSNAAQPIQSVSGAPGVQRQGNSYSAAPSAPAAAAPQRTNYADVLRNRRFGQDAATPAPAAPAAASTSQASTRPAPAATPASASPMSNTSVQSEQGRILAGVGQAMGAASASVARPINGGTGPSPSNVAFSKADTGSVGRGYADMLRNRKFGQAVNSVDRWAADNVLPVTNNALNTAARDAEQRWNSGDRAGAIGRTLGGALETIGSVPWDVYEYARRLGDATAPAANAFAAGLGGAPTPSQNPKPAAQTPEEAKAAAAAAQNNAFRNATLSDAHTPQQLEEIADRQRDAWQAQARGGLRGGNQEAMDLYNAEQMTRGSGISAQRGANGVMEFSGNGANATGGPAGAYTSGVDFGLRRDASGNIVGGAPNREELAAMRDELNFNRGAGGAFRRRGAEEMEREMLNSRSRSTRDAGVQLSQARMREQSAAMERGELGFGRQMAAQGQQLQNQRYQMETALLDQILNSPSANEQSMLIAHLRALRGGNEQNRYTVVPGGQEVTDQGMRTVPSRVFNNQTGQFVEQDGANIWNDPRAAAIRENPNMTLEQKSAALRELGYT